MTDLSPSAKRRRRTYRLLQARARTGIDVRAKCQTCGRFIEAGTAYCFTCEPRPDPREKGDDDGQEYADPRDERDERDDAWHLN